MKSFTIFLLGAFACLAHADPTTKEADNYQKELLELYNWTKHEFKPLVLIMVNISCQAVHNATEDPRVFEGQDPAIIQAFLDKIKQVASTFEEVKNHADSEDVTEKTIKAYKNFRYFKLTEGLTESAERHLDSILQEYSRKAMKLAEDALEKPSNEVNDRYVLRFDETMNKLTPSEKEAHPDITRWRDTKISRFSGKLVYFYHFWEFLLWAHDELNGAQPSDSE